MTRKGLLCFSCLAALAAMTAPAVAQPTIGLEDRGGGVGALTITTDEASALATSLRVDFMDGIFLVPGSSALSMTGLDPLDPSIILNLDGQGIDLNPFENPDGTFEPIFGLVEDGDSIIFAAVGLGDQGVRTFDLLTFSFEGVGDITASGLITSRVGGVFINSSVFSGVLTAGVPEPSTAVLAALGLAGFGFRRR